MSAKTDPFVRVTCKCPVCTREAINRYVKSKMFSPVKQDDDQFVSKYKWELEQYNRLRPEYFQVWHCPNCNFCEEKEVFRGEDTLDGKIDILKDKLLIESRRPDSIISKIGALIDFNSEFVNWSSALSAHILAIHIHNQLSTNMRLPGKLARLYLRVGWLFREKKRPEVTGGPIPDDPELNAVLNELRKEWPEGPYDEDKAVSLALENYKQELDNAGRSDNVRLEISIMMQLVALNKQLGDRHNAYEYARMIFQQCAKKRGSVRKALEGAARRDNITGRQIEQLRSLSQWLNNMVERSKGMAEELAQEIFDEEYDRARQEVMMLSEPTPETVLEYLREKGFFEGTCRRIAVLFKKRLLDRKLEDLSDAETTHDKQVNNKKNSGFLNRIVGMIKGEEEEE